MPPAVRRGPGPRRVPWVGCPPHGRAAWPTTCARATTPRSSRCCAPGRTCSPRCPSDLASLAARATTRPSVQRALDQLDRFALQVVEVLCALPDHEHGGRRTPAAGRRPGRRARAAARAGAGLRRRRGLAGGPAHRREVVGHAGRARPGRRAGAARLRPGPAGADRRPTWGWPPAGDPVDDRARAVAAVLGDDDRLDAPCWPTRPPAPRERWPRDLGAADRPARAGPPRRRRRPAPPARSSGCSPTACWSPPTPPRSCCPARSALHLRGGRVHRAAEPTAADRSTAPVDADRGRPGGGRCRGRRRPPGRGAARAVGGRAAEGAAGRRARRARPRPARPAALDVDEARLALLVETAHAAGLLAAGDDGARAEVWLPTPAYDGWLDRRRSRPLGWRWPAPGSASTRVPGLVGSRDERDRTLAPLGPDLDRTVGARRSAPPCWPTWPRCRPAPRRRPTSLAGPAALARAAPRRPAAGRPGRPGRCARREVARPRRPAARSPAHGRAARPATRDVRVDALERAAARRRSTTCCCRPT